MVILCNRGPAAPTSWFWLGGRLLDQASRLGGGKSAPCSLRFAVSQEGREERRGVERAMTGLVFLGRAPFARLQPDGELALFCLALCCKARAVLQERGWPRHTAPFTLSMPFAV